MQYASLSNQNISEGVEAISGYLESTGLKKADCIRLSFAIEEALLYYQENLGEEVAFNLVYGKKWGRDQFSISIAGESLNPFVGDEDEDFPSITQNIMQKAGFFPEWKHTSREGNIISMVLPKVPKAPLQKLILSVMLAAALYGVSFFLSEELIQTLYSGILVPISNGFMSVLSALSGPIIFISILCSIINMGDVATFGRIGKRCIKAFLSTVFLVTIISCFWIVFTYPIAGDGTTHPLDLIVEILALLLDMVPSNIFVFSLNDINPMQSVLLASFLGICILGIQKETPILSSFVNQCNLLLQCAMAFVTSYIHVFVFLCVSQLLLANQLNMILSAYRFFLNFLICYVFMLILDFFRIWRKTGCSPIVFLKKTFPTCLIGLTTDSSAAAFTTNINTCKKDFGIDNKLVEFAIPFGQVVYMPSAGIFMVVLSFFMCDTYNIAISPTMVFMIFFISVVLAIAIPPIPGGGVAIMSILLSQLGLPEEGLGITIVFLTICAPSLTALNLFGIHTEIICAAKDLGLIDEEVLRRKPKKRKK